MVPAMQSILRGEFPAPRTLHHALAPELEQVILTAMAYRPEARYPSADALGHALSDHLHRIGVRVGSRGLAETVTAEAVEIARAVAERRAHRRAPTPRSRSGAVEGVGPCRTVSPYRAVGPCSIVGPGLAVSPCRAASSCRRRWPWHRTQRRQRTP